MKQETNSKKILAGVLVLSLVAIGGTISGNIAWVAAGLLGHTALCLLSTRRQTKLARVPVRSSKNHK